MGVFKYPLAVGANPEGEHRVVSALVDTGAFYTWLPRPLLEGLGLRPDIQRPFQLASGEVVVRDVGRAWVTLDGQEEQTLVVFGDAGSMALLGAYTLEGFAVAVDPVNRRLVSLGALPMAAAPNDG
jgi:aspartyl protease family protein